MAGPSRSFHVLTPRTVIVATPTEAIEQRLKVDNFYADVDLGPKAAANMDYQVVSVRFPPDWPGESLDLFPAWLERRRADDVVPEPWTGTIIDLESLTAVGQMGCKALPDERGKVELVYGTNAGVRDRGYATEAGGAFVNWLLEQPGVQSVVAECLVTNAASVRVIEKLGFELLEEREDEEGRLLRWEKRRA
ncbi:MAG: GNAT family N-acetyltransferase [Trueperaceae bacterium]|nr:GNAT family N-acetyltransferase [Trueperaceae bacterium]